MDLSDKNTTVKLALWIVGVLVVLGGVGYFIFMKYQEHQQILDAEQAIEDALLLMDEEADFEDFDVTVIEDEVLQEETNDAVDDLVDSTIQEIEGLDEVTDFDDFTADDLVE